MYEVGCKEQVTVIHARSVKEVKVPVEENEEFVFAGMSVGLVHHYCNSLLGFGAGNLNISSEIEGVFLDVDVRFIIEVVQGIDWFDTDGHLESPLCTSIHNSTASLVCLVEAFTHAFCVNE